MPAIGNRAQARNPRLPSSCSELRLDRILCRCPRRVVRSRFDAVNTATGAAFPAANGNTSQWGGGIQLGLNYMMLDRMVIGLTADMYSGAPRRRQSLTPPAPARTRQRSLIAKPCVGAVVTPPIMSCFTRQVALRGRTINSSRRSYGRTEQHDSGGPRRGRQQGPRRVDCGRRHCLRLRANSNVFAEYRYTSFRSSTISLFSVLHSSPRVRRPM